MKKLINKNEKGITLIALVITIIVLLILAGVAISMLAGENGIINKTNSAKTENESATVEEQVKLAVMAALAEGYGKLEGADAFRALNDGLKDAGYSGEISSLPVTIDINGNSFKIDEKGVVTKASNDNFAKFMENPEAFIHPDQPVTNKNRAIGTDGTAVNMELWKYTIISEIDKTISLSSTDIYNPKGYIGGYTAEGKINGSMPQYMKLDGKEGIYTITETYRTFYNCSDLEIAPEIPSTVTKTQQMFYNCTKLKDITSIPNSVINANGMFQNCKALDKAPILPNGLENAESMFSGCWSLAIAPAIPNSVTNVRYMFEACIIVTAPKIPESVTSTEGMFKFCAYMTNPPQIPEGVKDTSSMFYACYGLLTAPELPVGVTNTNYMFGECKNLEIEQGYKLPEGITATDSMFSFCEKLKYAPELPSTVVSATQMFNGCINLEKAPTTMPANVKDWREIFASCAKLTTVPEVPANVNFLWGAFKGCTSLTGEIVIKGSNVTNAYQWSFGTNPITIKVPAGSTTYTSVNEAYGTTAGITIETY